MMRYLLIVLLAALTFPVVSSPIMPKDMVKLSPGEVLVSPFKQIRQIRGLPQPLLSEGQLLIWEGHGIIWQTNSPFPTTLVLTPRGLHTLEDDQLVKVQSLHQDKVFALLSKIMSGDLQSFEGFETTNSAREGKHWESTLEPTRDDLAQLFTSLSMKGADHVSQVIIERATGDIDTIQFTNPVIKSPEVLSPSEKAWLQNE